VPNIPKWSEKRTMPNDGVHWQENIYNQQVGRDQPKFKVWTSAGLMLTYWCPSRCACCYVFSGPEAHSPDTEMSVDLALQCWWAVRRLGGNRGKVHLTGGEPFGDFPRLEHILQAACEQGLSGLGKIETNAYWCTQESLVRKRLQRLKELGLKKLQISTDVYHQEYVSLDRVSLAISLGREILGPEGAQVRWRDFVENPVLIGAMDESQRAEAFRQALSKRPERMIGRAAEELVTLFHLRSYDHFADENCGRNLLGARHVHVDGAGNVFSGTCVGLIVGNVLTGEAGDLDELWRQFDYRQHPIISILVETGPVGLLQIARPLGYQFQAGYANKCHLCYDIRRYLYKNGKYSAYLGPSVCYGCLSIENRCERQNGT
jgi:organic radical activating enzyme